MSCMRVESRWGAVVRGRVTRGGRERSAAVER